MIDRKMNHVYYLIYDKNVKIVHQDLKMMMMVVLLLEFLQILLMVDLNRMKYVIFFK